MPKNQPTFTSFNSFLLSYSHAYLKKHQASHQILENLKSLEIFKNSNSIANPAFTHPMQQSKSQFPFTNATATVPTPRAPHTQASQHFGVAHPHTIKPYPQRFNPFPFPTFDQRRFYSLGELYLSQHLDHSSAFQYVQANHLRNLTAAATAFSPRPPHVPPPTALIAK